MPIAAFTVVLAPLGILFAFTLGRTAVKAMRDRTRQRAAIGWALRTTVCVYAIFYFGGLRWPFLVTLALAVAALAAGAWLEARPKKTEDLSQVMFPKE
jgi:hypothetical protein